jgi:2-iminobutanoate/2-iminopropanoate deaminase
MEKEIIVTEKVPSAIGPYSQAVRVGELLFISGQLGIDPTNGELAEEIEKQTKQAFENLKAILEAGGSSLEEVVKVNVFLRNMDNFSVMNEIYASYFTEQFPARCCVEVSKLPKEAEVEIDVIALRKRSI